MSKKTVRLNKNILSNLVGKGVPDLVNDSIVSGLRFKVGKKRSVFQFEKRVSGQKGPAITFTIGSYPAISVDEARQEARRLSNLCERGVDPRKPHYEGDSLALSKAIKMFFETKEKEIARNTIRKYKEILKHVPTEWMDLDIYAITPQMVLDRFEQIRSKNGKVVCWHFLKVFRAFWNTCDILFSDDQKVVTGRVKNPVSEILQKLKTKGIYPPTPNKSILTVFQLGRFVVTLEDLIKDKKNPPSQRMMYQIGLLTLFTGLRFSETRFLKWDYIDMEHGVIHLPGSIDDGLDFEGTKNRCDHWVALSTYAWDILKSRWEERDLNSPYVFNSTKNPRKPMARCYPAAELINKLMGSHYSPHASRRTFASIADEVGLGFLTVKRLLNHHFKGGVTGGYVVPGFNPAKERVHFQKVCDFILQQRAIYLGEKQVVESDFDKDAALTKLKIFAMELGLKANDVLEAFETELGDTAA